MTVTVRFGSNSITKVVGALTCWKVLQLLGIVRWEPAPLEAIEHAHIEHAVEERDTTYKELARRLGISEKTLWTKRKQM